MDKFKGGKRMIKTGILKGTLFIFGFLMFIGSLALIAVSAKFSTFEILAMIYIWTTTAVALAELPEAM
jgi:hypothetical protein